MRALTLLTALLILFSCRNGNVDIAENKFLNYFTFQEVDTASSITLNIATKDTIKELQVNFEDRVIDLKPNDFKYVPGLHVFRHKFTNLDPKKVYSYTVLVENKLSRTYKFKTIDNTKKEVKFIVGGDTGVDEKFEKLTKIAATYSPEVAVIGGDIAYANGNIKNWKKWVDWLTIWRDNAITPEGIQIPLITAIGNHETNPAVLFNKKKRAPFWFSLFNQSKKSYFYREVGKDNLFIILDTGHVAPFTKQKFWLKKNRKKFKSYGTKYAFYHIPLYPGHRKHYGPQHVAGRTLWEKEFNKIGIQVGFEHHDHVLKRTFPIKNGKKNDDGIIYIGDGAMGRSTRSVEPRWYLDKIEPTNHFWLVNITGEGKTDLKAIDLNNDIADDIIVNK